MFSSANIAAKSKAASAPARVEGSHETELHGDSDVRESDTDVAAALADTGADEATDAVEEVDTGSQNNVVSF